MNDLKPCPFCGGTALELERCGGHYSWIQCLTCTMQGPNGATDEHNSKLYGDHTKNDRLAEELWNRRAS